MLFFHLVVTDKELNLLIEGCHCIKSNPSEFQEDINVADRLISRLRNIKEDQARRYMNAVLSPSAIEKLTCQHYFDTDSFKDVFF